MRKRVFVFIFIILFLILFEIVLVRSVQVSRGCNYCDRPDNFCSTTLWPVQGEDCTVGQMMGYTWEEDCYCNEYNEPVHTDPGCISQVTSIQKGIEDGYNFFKQFTITNHQADPSACESCRGEFVDNIWKFVHESTEPPFQSTRWYIGECVCPSYDRDDPLFTGCYTFMNEGWYQCVHGKIGYATDPDGLIVNAYEGVYVRFNKQQNYVEGLNIRETSIDHYRWHGACNPIVECPLYPDCPGDVNGDGEVNEIDLIILTSLWLADGCDNTNQCCSGGDMNDDGIVNLVDLAILQGNFGNIC